MSGLAVVKLREKGALQVTIIDVELPQYVMLVTADRDSVMHVHAQINVLGIMAYEFRTYLAHIE